MFKILSQPYPFSERSISQIITQSILEGAFIALFLIIIQPFGISNIVVEYKIAYLISYGITTTLCVLIIRFIIFKKYKKYSDQAGWTIGKEIIAIIALLLLITVFNYLLTIFLFDLTFNLKGVLSMFFMVLVIGIFPIVFGVMLNYIFQLKKYQKPIEINHNHSTDSPLESEKKLILFADNEKDKTEFSINDLYYIESSDNYSTIFYEKENRIIKELLRSSLTRLEGQILATNIVRCHRSFIVNLDKVEKVTGNAQGYKFHLKVPEMQVPVARKYSALVERLK
jgi:FlaA1/EpsC-like NDP-sugar epimerase